VMLPFQLLSMDLAIEILNPSHIITRRDDPDVRRNSVIHSPLGKLGSRSDPVKSAGVASTCNATS